MDYQKIYNQIVERAQKELKARKKLKEEGGYYEGHHIVPHCLGGKGKSSNWNHPNIVPLTAREHFICHWLLARAYPDNTNLVFAFNAMVMFSSNNLQSRYTPSSRIIAEAKKISSKHKKGQTLEEKVGIKRAKEIREHYSNIRKGRTAWNRGLPATESQKEALSKARKGQPGTFTGRKHTNVSKKKMSLAKKGKYLGKNSPSYGSGKLIKELSTGFEGTITDHQIKFGFKYNTSIYSNIKRNKPFRIGDKKGLQFIYK